MVSVVVIVASCVVSNALEETRPRTVAQSDSVADTCKVGQGFRMTAAVIIGVSIVGSIDVWVF